MNRALETEFRVIRKITNALEELDEFGFDSRRKALGYVIDNENRVNKDRVKKEMQAFAEKMNAKVKVEGSGCDDCSCDENACVTEETPCDPVEGVNESC